MLLIGAATIYSCQDHSRPVDAQSIINASITAHGSRLLESGTMSFEFRNIPYTAARDNGTYTYTRELMGGGDTLLDRLSNLGFDRMKNGQLLILTDSIEQRYSSSLNSVIYFAQLPLGLDSPAINYEYVSLDTINGRQYHEVRVTFDENGGGEDHEDVFVYWIGEEDSLVDYLAYSYCEEDCGLRFRESVNRRNLNGVIIQDYNNYKAPDFDTDLTDLDELFQKGDLIKVSEINLDEVKITIP